MFTSQSVVKFYDKLFSALDFELPHADTGHKGFSKEAMHCAFIVMKSEGFSLITDLTALAVAYAAVLNESCHSYRSLKHLRRAG